MQVGNSRMSVYTQSARFSVTPAPLAAPPSEPRQAATRREVVAEAARSYAQSVPKDDLRALGVGQAVVERTVSASSFETGIQAYRRQEQQAAAWRSLGSVERDQTSITSGVTSAAGGVMRGVGSLLDQRV